MILEFFLKLFCKLTKLSFEREICKTNDHFFKKKIKRLDDENRFCKTKEIFNIEIKFKP